jgi:hypothetical protein
MMKMIIIIIILDLLEKKYIYIYIHKFESKIVHMLNFDAHDIWRAT